MKITLEQLILCLPNADKRTLLQLVEKAHDSLQGGGSLEVDGLYDAIKAEIRTNTLIHCSWVEIDGVRQE